MQNNPVFLIELLIFGGAALAWASYELWSVRRSTREKKSAPPSEPGHPEG